jgi:REP element-mobilizing transposase RayT
MPRKSHAWWRVDIGTYCSWLPGDKRGFRSRDHDIHSSGDYKHRPPPEEHEGLRDYHEEHTPGAIVIPRDLRLIVASVIAEILLSMNFRVLVVSCADKHAHIVAELPIDLKHFNRVIGRAKAMSSAAIRERLPGRVWARDDKHDMLRTRSYRHNAYLYVRNKQGPQAAVWCFDGIKREAMKD